MNKNYTIKTSQVDDMDESVLTAEITHNRDGAKRKFRITVNKDGLSIWSLSDIEIHPYSSNSVRIDAQNEY